MHATWRKAAGIRRFAEPILVPLRLSCALQTQWLFDQDPLVTLRASFERRIGEACISTQYPSQSPFEAGSLDPLSRFGATSRVIFAFDHAVSDEDNF